MALRNARLVGLPEFGGKQIGVVAHEHIAHRRVGQQEGGKGLREHVAGAYTPPDLAAHFLFFIARGGYDAEVARRQVFNLVIVVEHHLAAACDAKVLPQHVAGKDVGCHQVLDGIAILQHGALQGSTWAGVIQPGIHALLEKHVQRQQAALDVEVVDDDFQLPIAIAVADVNVLGRLGLQGLQQLGRKAVHGQRHHAVFHGVCHAAYAVVLLDQAVLGLHLFARDFLGRGEFVLDELEHVREARQVKHQHHQPLNAGSNAELVRAVPQMVQQVAVEQGLALLGQPQSAIDFAARLAWHQTVQKLHIGAGNGHVHQKIGACKAEQAVQIFFVQQHGMQHQPAAVAGMQDGNGQRNFGITRDDLAHHIGTLVSKEQAAEHLNLKIGTQAQPLQALADAGSQQGDVTAQTLKPCLELKVPDHAVQRRHQGIEVAGVKRAEGRLSRRFQIFCADGWPHKDKVVLKVRAVQDFGGDGVKERLRQLRLQMPHHQANVVQLDLLPHDHGQAACVEFGVQLLHAFVHTLVIESNALTLGTLLADPVGLLKTRFRRLRGGAKPLVVAVYALHHRKGNGISLRSIESLRKHGKNSRSSQAVCQSRLR